MIVNTNESQNKEESLWTISKFKSFGRQRQQPKCEFVVTPEEL